MTGVDLTGVDLTGVDLTGVVGLLAVTGLIAGLPAITDLAARAGLAAAVGFTGKPGLTASGVLTAAVFRDALDFATEGGLAVVGFDRTDAFAIGFLALTLTVTPFATGFADFGFRAGFFFAACLAFTNGFGFF